MQSHAAMSWHNESVVNPNSTSGIGQLLAETSLIDLHHHKYSHKLWPPTYNCGTNTIGIMCIGSLEFMAALTAASILPFGIPIYLSSDHRALLLDFNSKILFDYKPPPKLFIYLCGVNSNAQPTVTKYSKLIGMGCNHADINACITAIKQLPNLNDHDQSILNDIDKTVTTILMEADCRCRRFNAYPWSPELHLAFLEYQYWSLQLSKLGTKQSYEAAYNKIILILLKDTKLELNQRQYAADSIKPARNLRVLCQLAQIKCREFLNSLLKAATATKNKDKKSDTWIETGQGKTLLLLNGMANPTSIHTRQNLGAFNTLLRGSYPMDTSHWQRNYGGTPSSAQQKSLPPSSQYTIHATTTFGPLGIQWTHTVQPTNFQQQTHPTGISNWQTDLTFMQTPTQPLNTLQELWTPTQLWSLNAWDPMVARMNNDITIWLPPWHV